MCLAFDRLPGAPWREPLFAAITFLTLSDPRRRPVDSVADVAVMRRSIAGMAGRISKNALSLKKSLQSKKCALPSKVG